MKVLSAPGKTFFVGEYLALVGGPSILVATKPRFQLSATPSANTESPFAPLSPAGKFLTRHKRDLENYQIHFEDPHSGAGGLGASSAQFAMLYALKFGLSKDWASILEEYRQCAWSGEGAAPSGADVVAQIHGGLTWFEGREFSARELSWDFPSLSYSLIHTKTKLATHEHLKKHQPAPQEAMRDCVQQATRAFETRDEKVLIESVTRYATALKESGRTAEHTSILLNKLNREPWVLAAKGCGAMGSDVILVLHDLAGAKLTESWAASEGLPICGGLDAMDTGLRFET